MRNQWPPFIFELIARGACRGFETHEFHLSCAIWAFVLNHISDCRPGRGTSADVPSSSRSVSAAGADGRIEFVPHRPGQRCSWPRVGDRLAFEKDFPAEGDPLDPASPAFARLSLQRGWPTAHPPRPTLFGMDAGHPFPPALCRDPQPIPERGFIGRDPADSTNPDLATGPLQPFVRLGEDPIHPPRFDARGPGIRREGLTRLWSRHGTSR